MIKKKRERDYIGGGRLLQCSLAEKKLVAAIINQSFLDIHSQNCRIKTEAIEWLHSERAFHYAEMLSIDGEVLLKGVMYHIELAEAFKKAGATQKSDASANGFKPMLKIKRPAEVFEFEQLLLSLA